MLRSEPASYRDHRARIVYEDREVYRIVFPAGAAGYRQVRPVLDRLVAEGLLLACDEVDCVPFARLGAEHAIRHPRILVVSYPYEWSFGMLKAAALLHLDLHLRALDLGATLTDGSAYNVQFLGAKPVFIDCTSIVPYEANAYWDGYGQFCDQFLGPLLLAARGRVPFQRWYRGAPEGLPPEWVERALPLSARLRPGIALNIGMNANARRHPGKVTTASPKPLPLAGLRWLLRNLRGLIQGLEPGPPTVATIVDYGRNSPHSQEYQNAKQRAVARFVADEKPACLLDVGCNTGTYSRLALSAGASDVIAIDGDPWAVDEVFRSGAADGARILPLVIDLQDPSPAQGWRGKERRSLDERISCDAILALALIHHMCLTRKLPLGEVVEWFVTRAPSGLIEFVPRDDPWAQELGNLVRGGEDVYSAASFERELRRHAHVVSEELLAGSVRRLYRYRRT
jgi:ribosomal protein L11 methylase PrmA